MSESDQPHDIIHYMEQVASEMQSEYIRISSRSSEDAGTAGDEGEENWCELLRGWLPDKYKIVTKGRILTHNNVASPQMDIIVLRSDYPEKLISKKYYLSVGVVAAFECKTTLRKEGLRKTMKNAKRLNQLLNEVREANSLKAQHHNENSAYAELHRPILYGLLAHSHDFGSDDVKARENISGIIKQCDQEILIRNKVSEHYPEI